MSSKIATSVTSHPPPPFVLPRPPPLARQISPSHIFRDRDRERETSDKKRGGKRGGGRGRNPTSNGGMQNGSPVRIHTRFIHVFCTFRTDLYAQSVLINVNFCIGAQSETYWECVVGWEGRRVATFAIWGRGGCPWGNKRSFLFDSSLSLSFWRMGGGLSHLYTVLLILFFPCCFIFICFRENSGRTLEQEVVKFFL